jgi:transcriptional regulator with XRE-family HTH domain
MTHNEVSSLRSRLKMSRAQFARLTGVDVRTVSRWESPNGPRPTGAGAAVIRAIVEAIALRPHVEDKNLLIESIRRDVEIGGLSYLLVRLLQERRVEHKPPEEQVRARIQQQSQEALARMIVALTESGVSIERKKDVPYFFADGEKIVRLLNNERTLGRIAGGQFVADPET